MKLDSDSKDNKYLKVVKLLYEIGPKTNKAIKTFSIQIEKLSYDSEDSFLDPNFVNFLHMLYMKSDYRTKNCINWVLAEFIETSIQRVREKQKSMFDKSEEYFNIEMKLIHCYRDFLNQTAVTDWDKFQSRYEDPKPYVKIKDPIKFAKITCVLTQLYLKIL